MLLFSLVAVAAQAQRIPEYLHPKVEVEVSAGSSIESLVRSYLNRELRSIPDVVLVDDDGDYTLTVVAMKVGGETGTLGVVLSSVVMEAVSAAGLLRVAVKGSGVQLSQEQLSRMTEFAQRQGEYGTIVSQRLLAGPQNSLQARCQNIVADFDGEQLETYRRTVRNLLRDQ